MTEETTTEQLAEIEGQAEDTPATEYTPPEGWRVLRSGELLQPGDHWVNWEGTVSRPDIQHGDGATVSGGRYIRWVKPQPQPSPQPVPEPDAELRIRLLKEANDSQAETIGRLMSEACDLNMEIGGLERQLLQRDARIRDLETMHAAAAQAVVDAGKQNDALRLQVQNRQQEYERQKNRIQFLETLDAGNAVAICDYKAKVEKLQGLVDTARGQLETAATEHDSLSTQLAAVKAELVTQAETSRRLQIELDAAQQVPADSPELRQLRADLAEVTQDRDTYRHAHELLVNDVNATHQRTKVMTVEAIAEWLVPVQAAIAAADNVAESTRAGWLAEEVIQHLPQIMRSLTGLDSND